MFKGINAIEFNKRFSSNEACYQYLIDWKWGKGFLCSRCGCDQNNKGRTSFHRRCKQCNYDESVLANTIFHGMKMPILKAFHMIFRLTAKKKGMSTIELGAEVGVEQKTAWLFKRKIQVAMKQDNTDKLHGNIDVDETLLGFHTGRKDGGRSLEKRKALMVAVQILPDGRTGNIRMQDIENFKADTLKYAIKDMVQSTASIRADDYCSYHTLQQQGMNIQIQRSQNGKAFEELHRQIMQFKNWLVGIHHRWSKEHLFAYADEYVFRFNRRNNRKNIFNSLIGLMMQQIPHPYPVIKRLCAYST
jgi:ISXO2-like transposase domain/Transposase zinc-ribbon domain